MGYNASGLVTRRDMPGNVVIAYMTYDARSGRLSELKQHQGVLGLQTKSYVRNENGAIVRVTTNGSLDYFSYDGLDRLVHDAEPLSGPSGTNNYYEYDAASNRSRKNNKIAVSWTYYTYDSRNLLTIENTTASPTTYYDHDAAQRMTRQRSSAVASYFAFNQRDQIARLQNVKAVSPDPIHYFSYSGADERLRIADGNGEAYWSFDGDKLLREKAPGGAIAARYRHNTCSSLDTMSMLLATFNPGGGTVTAVPRYDERGSVTRMVSTAGDVAESYAYDRFGLTTPPEGGQRARFVPNGPFIAINVTQGGALTEGGLWLPGPSVTCGGSGRKWAPWLGSDPLRRPPLPAKWAAPMVLSVSDESVLPVFYCPPTPPSSALRVYCRSQQDAASISPDLSRMVHSAHCAVAWVPDLDAIPIKVYLYEGAPDSPDPKIWGSATGAYALVGGKKEKTLEDVSTEFGTSKINCPRFSSDTVEGTLDAALARINSFKLSYFLERQNSNTLARFIFAAGCPGGPFSISPGDPPGWTDKVNELIQEAEEWLKDGDVSSIWFPPAPTELHGERGKVIRRIAAERAR